MSENPPPPPHAYAGSTPADHDARMASVFWVAEQQSAGRLEAYRGTYLAVLGETILDNDPSPEELGRRLDALGGTIPWNRVVVQYIHRPEDWHG